MSIYDTSGDDGDAVIQADADFPGSVLALLAERCPILGGTQVHVEVIGQLGDNSAMRLCNANHVHIYLGIAMPLTGINVVLLYGWAFARAIDAVKWAQVPDADMVIATLEACCVEIEPDLPALVNHARHSHEQVRALLATVGRVKPSPHEQPPEESERKRESVIEETGTHRKVPPNKLH